MIFGVDLDLSGRKVQFSLDLDPESVQDNSIAHYLQRGMPCEPEVCHALARALHDGDFAVDGGANVGFFTILMSRFVGETGRVIAVEPGENNLVKLRRNLEINRCENVTIVERPLWSEAGANVKFYSYHDGGGSTLFGKLGEVGTPMMATTLDEIVGAELPVLIKLDIEGAEYEAVLGAADLLRFKPLIVSELNQEALEAAGESALSLQALMKQNGYMLYVLSDDGRLPAAMPPASELVLSRPNANVLFGTPTGIGTVWPKVMV